MSKDKAKRIYVTGPRNGNFGFGEGTLTLYQAYRYIGDSIDNLYNAPWRNRNEKKLACEGRLRSLYMEGDVIRLGGFRD